MKEICGPQCIELFDVFDHYGWLPKMFRDRLLISKTWSNLSLRAKIMKCGLLVYRLERSGPRILGIDFGSLPTPRKTDGRGQYMATLKIAVTRVGPFANHQAHWIHVYLFLKRLNRGWANPQFSEWMMGYPIGWTDLEQSGMQLSLK